MVHIKFKLREEFRKISDSFKLRDKEIRKIKDEIKGLSLGLVSRKEIELMIENAILKAKSGPKSGPNSEPIKKKNNYERVMVGKIKKNHSQAVKTAILRLIEEDMRTIDIYNLIVLEKKLCGKTQFYHYLSLVRTELRTGLRTNIPN